MTKLDNTIIKSSIITLALILAFGLIFHNEITIKCIGAAIGLVYLGFMVSHVFLALPLIAIFGITEEICYKYMRNIYHYKSQIIYLIIRTIIQLIALIIIYYFVPIILTMMVTYTNDFELASEIYSKFAFPK